MFIRYKSKFGSFVLAKSFKNGIKLLKIHIIGV